MKRYISASSNPYYDISRRVTDYFTSVVKKAGCTNSSYDDYRVEPDWAGGGISITLQWDGNAISEKDVAHEITSYFGQGFRCHDSWGRWDHQITVHIDEWRCR